MTIVFVEANSTGTTSAAIRLAREHGYRTAFVTQDRPFYSRIPDDPLQLADTVLDANTYDPLAVLRAVGSTDVEAVVSFDDYHLPVAAICARELGLPHAPLAGLLATRFKDVMRHRTADAGVAFHTIGAGEPAMTHLPYPVVVKPVDESGSVAVRRCDTPSDLVAAVDAFAGHVVNARGYRPSRSLLVEEYLDGPEYSCELVWDAAVDRWSVCGFTRKALGPEPHFVEVGHLFPAELDPDAAAGAARAVIGWMDAVGLVCGAAHVEFRLTAAGPRLVEINPRLPGGHITELVLWCTGIDMVAAYLAFHLRDRGARFGREPVAPTATKAATRHLMASELAVPGAAAALREAELPSLRRFELKDVDPTTLSAVDRTNYDRFGYLLLASADPDAVRTDLDAANALLRPRTPRHTAGSTR